MAALHTVRVPDLGDSENVDVVEILVAPGDRVSVDDSLITLESDKATMEVPSPVAGTVREILVSLNDSVNEGDPIANLELSAEDAPVAEAAPAAAEEPSAPEPAAPSPPAPVERVDTHISHLFLAGTDIGLTIDNHQAFITYPHQA